MLTAGHDSSPDAREALEQLCRAYWYPLYCYARRQAGSAADAEDLTQSFFAHLLERNTLAKVSREKGRFRSFLLAALNYFLADAWDKARAQKRGGGCVVVSLNEAGAEERYQRECGGELTAEQLYERRWAMAVLDRASVWLREEFAVAGKAALGEELRGLQENAAGAVSPEVGGRWSEAGGRLTEGCGQEAEKGEDRSRTPSAAITASHGAVDGDAPPEQGRRLPAGRAPLTRRH